MFHDVWQGQTFGQDAGIEKIIPRVQSCNIIKCVAVYAACFSCYVTSYQCF
jgi:hypothetical protein